MRSSFVVIYNYVNLNWTYESPHIEFLPTGVRHIEHNAQLYWYRAQEGYVYVYIILPILIL